MRGPLMALGMSLVLGTGSAQAGTFEDVQERGRLVCGVSEGLRGFSQQSGELWSGFDVDFCRAVAAAVLGDGDAVDFAPLSAEARFDALEAGEVDLLSRNSTWTGSRDLARGIDFAGVIYYDGQGFLVPALYGMSSVYDLEGARICVVSGTTTQTNASAFFEEQGMEVSFFEFEERAEARAAYEAGVCDTYTGDRSALAAERSLLNEPDGHVILRDAISKEPLGPVTRDDDGAWVELVRWVLFALINAEEARLGTAAVAGDRLAEAVTMGSVLTAAFDLREDWLATVLASTGHYGEIFERNLGSETPLALRRGLNALWTEGGLLYAPPMR